MQIAKGIWHCITSIKQMQRRPRYVPTPPYRVSKYEAKRHEPQSRLPKAYGIVLLVLSKCKEDRGMFLNKHYEIPFVKEYAAVLISKVNKKRHMPLRKSSEALLAFCIAIYERRCLWI